VSLRHLASNTKVVMTTDDEDDLTDDQIISKMKEIIEDGNSLSVKISVCMINWRFNVDSVLDLSF